MADAKRIAQKRVLLADDNPMNLELMAEMIRKDGHAVTAVSGGEAALERLATEAFDIVFLDYNMGEVDGAMVLQTYRFSHVRPAAVFFVTADTTPMTAESLAGLGAAGVIHKPLTFSKLRRAFHTAFPCEAVHRPMDEEHSAERPASGLAAVPVAYLDTGILDELREIRAAPGFLARIVAEAMHDIEQLGVELSDACIHTDLHAVHRAAHTLKGVSVNIGAVRMASIADRLMGLTYDELLSSPQRWNEAVIETAEQTVKALGDLGRKLSPPQVVND